MYRWIRNAPTSDSHDTSELDIKWDHISSIIDSLSDIEGINKEAT